MARNRKTPNYDPAANAAASRQGQAAILRATRNRTTSRNVTTGKNPNTKARTRLAMRATQQGKSVAAVKQERAGKAQQLLQARASKKQAVRDTAKSRNKTRRAMKGTWYGVEGNTRLLKKKLGSDIARTSRLTGKTYDRARKAGKGVVKSTLSAAGTTGKRILKRHKGLALAVAGTGVAVGTGIKKLKNK